MSFFVTRPLSIDPRDVVGDEVPVRVFAEDRPPSREELVEGARGCATLLTLVSDPIDGAVLDALPEVRHVAQVAVGYDNVDVEACRAREVLVTHTPDVLTDATADLTWALLLAVARRLREGERMVREGRFGGWSPTMLLGMELAGRTLGIYGLGRIGRAVAARARGFGMEVIYCSRSAAPAEVEAALGARRVRFEALLASSDVISVHAPLTPETRHAFDAAALAAMKPGALLINTARGPLVDEASLAPALDDGPLAGVGLDVYEREPEVHPGLLGRDDVVLLPHLGSATEAARRRMATTALTDALRVARGEPPRHPIPELRG
ncbi:MAG TPA: D-glycerate dehydrogenase [Sandaracinaceae bacterium LLY-WYZ-13_1]|nr:D-glycerate dehydrogenase [Sandaracinaceae bacterium LLY-WYZ-13_1]